MYVKFRSTLFAALSAIVITGCAGPPTVENNLSLPATDALAIEGSAATSVRVGETYLFRPVTTGGAGPVHFTIQNGPSWASFDANTGALTGSPAAADVGTTSNIVISASDGGATASLPPFALTVTQIATGSATVSWTPPTQNTDGSALANLAGFRIAYGTSAQALNHVVEVANVGMTRYVIDNLSPATYFFAVKAYTTAGVESDYSNIASKTIN
jgi:hypothetical protein